MFTNDIKRSGNPIIIIAQTRWSPSCTTC